MAQSVKCMFYNHKDLCLIPRIHAFFLNNNNNNNTQSPTPPKTRTVVHTCTRVATVSSLA